LAITIVLTACSKPAPPQLTPREVVLTELSPTGANLRLKLGATNPNAFALSANSFKAHLTFDNGHIDAGTVNVAMPFSLAPNTTTELDVPVTLSYAGIAALGVLAAQKPQIPYTVEGTVNVGGEKLNVDLPYTLSGTVTQAQIVQATVKGATKIPGLQGLGGLLAPAPSH
jgi:LEA14-like dessication related protein